MSHNDSQEITLTGGGRSTVVRRGNVVFREAGAWTASVHVLLRYLESVGFAAVPQVIGSGFDAEGREAVGYVEGNFVHPHAMAQRPTS